MGKHTKGPWRVEQGEGGILWVSSPNTHCNDICDLYHRELDGTFFIKENAAENAPLIAAAPEMLEILKKFTTDYEIRRHLIEKWGMKDLYNQMQELLNEVRS